MLKSDYAAFLILLSALNPQGFVFAMYSPAEAMSVPERVRYYDRSVVLMDRLAAMWVLDLAFVVLLANEDTAHSAIIESLPSFVYRQSSATKSTNTLSSPIQSAQPVSTESGHTGHIQGHN